MADDSVQGDDETGDRGLGELPEDINFGPFQGQVPLYALPEFLRAASAERNRPTARSVAGASITSRGSALYLDILPVVLSTRSYRTK